VRGAKLESSVKANINTKTEHKLRTFLKPFAKT